MDEISETIKSRTYLISCLPAAQHIPGLLSTVGAACQPVFEVLSIDQISAHTPSKTSSRSASGWRELR